ncbi:MAG: 30S ribosomal protein S15 [Candidatus Hodarchaeota archaeon]
MVEVNLSENGSGKQNLPAKMKPYGWIKYSPEEIEEIIVKLSKEGIQAAMIGTVLRDTYGIPSVKIILDKPITAILKDHGLAPRIPEDLQNLVRSAIKLAKHIEAHPKDLHSLRGLQLAEARIHRLSKYYRQQGVIPSEWRYSRARAISLLR